MAFYSLNFSLISNKSSILLILQINLCYFHFDIPSSLIMPFMSYLISYDFTLILLQHSGFHKLSFHNFISKIPQCDTWCSYAPLQFHVLYTLSGQGVTSGVPRVSYHGPLTKITPFASVLGESGSPVTTCNRGLWADRDSRPPYTSFNV